MIYIYQLNWNTRRDLLYIYVFLFFIKLKTGVTLSDILRSKMLSVKKYLEIHQIDCRLFVLNARELFQVTLEESVLICGVVFEQHHPWFVGGRPGRNRMVVGFTTTYAISAYHHWCCEFESRSCWGVQHYVITFVSDLRQVGGFVRILRFPPPIKLTVTI